LAQSSRHVEPIGPTSPCAEGAQWAVPAGCRQAGNCGAHEGALRDGTACRILWQGPQIPTLTFPEVPSRIPLHATDGPKDEFPDSATLSPPSLIMIPVRASGSGGPHRNHSDHGLRVTLIGEFIARPRWWHGQVFGRETQ
jgi:hypothetical protein